MRKVKYAKLQGTDAFLPGLMNFGTTLPPDKGAGKTFDVEMFEDGDKLLLNIKRNGVLFEAFVPLTNVQIALYDDAAPAAPAKPAKKAS